MAVLEVSVASKTRESLKKMPKKDKKKVLVVAQELKLARILAGNNKTARDRALKSLKKWFHNRAATIPFTEDDFLRLWKGLFYSMWMSDKPLIQEECAENISSLVHSLPLDTSVLFYKCGMTILMNEWFGIDQLRLDKFLMFVRRLLRQILFVLKNENWTRSSVQKFAQVLSETILNTETQKPTGLLMHFIEIYLEELAKVSDGELNPQLTTEFLKPFIKQLSFSDDPRIIDHIRKFIFIYLIRQSDLGLDYEDKYKAWKSLGFPGSIDSMKKIDVSDDESIDGEVETSGVKVYDPRAGKVNVDLPQLKFHPKAIAKALSENKFAKATNSKSRRCLTELAENFKKMSSGIYPIGVKKVKLATNHYDTSIRKAVNRLVKFDRKIKGKKNHKRKIDSDNEIELRGGKKIKLDDQLRQKIQEEFNDIVKRKKRKNNIVVETSPQKQKKKEEALEVESIFRRNSGTWLVTKSLNPENQSHDEDFVQEEFKSPENNKEQMLFPRSEWESSPSGRLEIEITTSMKKKKRVSLPANLIKNPFANSTPVKKVKINTKLNRSQDVQEHVAQILSSPAIPYDANRKPTKPLLKTPIMKSPINPFFTD